MAIRRLNPLISLGLLIVALHGTLLFVVIPRVSDRVTPLYNQDRFLDAYDEIAANLAHGHGYRFYPDTAQTTMREPGYPVFLAGLILLFGETFTAVKVANVCLALGTAWLILHLARRVSSNRLLPIVASLLFLFHPAILIAESRGGVELLFTFFVTLFLLVLYSALERRDWWSYAIAGAVLGLAVLVRSTPMLFPLFLGGYLLLFERKRMPVFAISGNIAVLVLAMVAVMSPWIIRNYSVTHKFVPTASVLGVSAHAGEYICSHLSEDKPWYLLDRAAAQERTRLATERGYQFRDGYYYQAFYSAADELGFSSYLTQRVFSAYKENPLLCAKCMSLNLFHFWFTGKSKMSTVLNVLVQLPYLILAIAGVVLTLKRQCSRTIGPWVVFILYTWAVCIPILAQARYSVPLIPLLAILAAMALFARGEMSLNSAFATSSPTSTNQLSQGATEELVGSCSEKR